MVHFVVTMTRDKLVELERDGLHKAFKLQTTTSITSMVCTLIISSGIVIMFRKYEVIIVNVLYSALLMTTCA